MKRFALKVILTVFLLLGLCAIAGIAEGNMSCWLFGAIALIGTNAACGGLLKGEPNNGKRKRRST